ncbi:hypothetical protein [Azospirillum rugosum]|uniref:Sel1 repeat-containing protein n=1 Tax=Azospirillum rugosum TaxID=416170 RepID=A0ABS4SFW7_9PROT|nr:hypothetical protein [Azospirillum rugosum]MBP2291453.1 hypothetical protein [Azospirillum rugosum]MDQ0525241.1 hypothetical protein [Azospirillum rugosum]
MHTGHLAFLPYTVLANHRVFLAATTALAMTAGMPATARSDDVNEWRNVRPSAPEPPASGQPAQPDDPFMIPYLAAEVMPGVAGVPTPLIIVVSPPIRTNSTTVSETYVRISKMPANAALSHGRNLGNGTWRVPLDELPNLAITLAPDHVGTTRLSVTAVSEHGNGLVGQRSVDLDVPMRATRAANAPSPPRDDDTANKVNQSTGSVTTEALALRSVVPTDRPKAETKPPAPQPIVAFAVPTAPPAPSGGSTVPADAQRLLKRGQELFAQGDLAGARLFFRRAAASGSAEASLALGKTYDPLVLERMHVRGLSPDPEQAVRFYGEAVAKGVADADRPLKELTGWFATHRK